MKDTRSCIIGFFLLLVFQVLVLDNLHLNGLYNAYIYIWFILYLPYHIHPSMLVLLSFAAGLVVDIFSGTAGMNALACSATGYLRYLLLRHDARSERERGWAPGLAKTGFSWYFRYAAVLVLAHHVCLFLVEAWSLDHFSHTMLGALCSSALTLALIFACELLFTEKS